MLGPVSNVSNVLANLIDIQISAMGAGCLGADSKDVLFVGSQTHFLAYDVHNNSDLFYRFVLVLQLQVVLIIQVKFTRLLY